MMMTLYITSLQDLQVLFFTSWWNENVCGKFCKRHIDIYFHIKTGTFQIIVEKVDNVYTVSHVNAKGKRIEAWDLYLGSKISILGRNVTLMKVNNPNCLFHVLFI